MPHEDVPGEQCATDTSLRPTLARALKLLNCKQMSTWELKQRLIAEDHPQEAVGAVLAQCATWGYLSDQRLADAIVAGALRRGKGPVWVRQALSRRGLNPADATQALNETSGGELGQVRALVAKRYGSDGLWHGDLRLRGKIMRFLSSRGFSAHVISKALGQSYDVLD